MTSSPVMPPSPPSCRPPCRPPDEPKVLVRASVPPSPPFLPNTSSLERDPNEREEGPKNRPEAGTGPLTCDYASDGGRQEAGKRPAEGRRWAAVQSPGGIWADSWTGEVLPTPDPLAEARPMSARVKAQADMAHWQAAGREWGDWQRSRDHDAAVRLGVPSKRPRPYIPETAQLHYWDNHKAPEGQQGPLIGQADRPDEPVRWAPQGAPVVVVAPAKANGGRDAVGVMFTPTGRPSKIKAYGWLDDQAVVRAIDRDYGWDVVWPKSIQEAAYEAICGAVTKPVTLCYNPRERMAA